MLTKLILLPAIQGFMLCYSTLHDHLSRQPRGTQRHEGESRSRCPGKHHSSKQNSQLLDNLGNPKKGTPTPTYKTWISHDS